MEAALEAVIDVDDQAAVALLEDTIDEDVSDAANGGVWHDGGATGLTQPSMPAVALSQITMSAWRPGRGGLGRGGGGPGHRRR